MIRAALRGAVGVYRLAISPLLGPRCRFLPTCSDYAQQALSEHKLGHAMALIARRLSRCHPFGASGLDEPPSGMTCRCGAHSARRSLFSKASF